MRKTNPIVAAAAIAWLVANSIPAFAQHDRNASGFDAGMPLRTVDGVLIARVRTAAGPVDLLLDTGSPRTMLYPAAASALELRQGRATQVRGMAGTGEAALASENIDLDFTPSLTASVRPILLDENWMPGSSSFVAAHNMEVADGILGMDALGQFRFGLCFEIEPMLMLSPSVHKGSADRLMLPAEVSGRRVECLIDTGQNAEELIITHAFENADDLISEADKTLPATSRNGVPVYDAVLAVEFPGSGVFESIVRVEDAPVGDHPEANYAYEPPECFVPEGYLRHFDLIVDTVAGEGMLRRHSEPSLEHNRTGLLSMAWRGPDAGFIVERVAADSPSYRAGLRAGQTVLSVDGVDMASEPYRELSDGIQMPMGGLNRFSERSRRQAGDVIELEIDTGTDRRTVEIELEDLL